MTKEDKRDRDTMIVGAALSVAGWLAAFFVARHYGAPWLHAATLGNVVVACVAMVCTITIQVRLANWLSKRK